MKDRKKIIHVVIGVIAFVAIVAFALWLSAQVSENPGLRNAILNYGYPGVFLIAFVSGFNVVVPVPVISFLPALTEAGLDFWLSIFIITIGMTLGDTLGFFIGHVSRKYTDIENKKLFAYLSKLKEKHFWLPIAFMALWAMLAPLPNELIVIPLAILGYKYWHVLLAALIGNFVFNVLIAHGITNLFEAIIH